ncbi:MAG: hypothetical protein KGI27_08840 [Thaumarchaeota archaeon]|nr:hypothetical protein [Nitrososphaerota archaeon]
MSNQEKTSKLKEIKDSILGAVEIIHQIKASETLEFFDKINDASFVAKEIINGLKSPEMVKNIENLRLISENFNEASARTQNTIKYLEETGIINESVRLVKSTRGTLEFIHEAGKDFHEISDSVKEIFHSVRTAQSKIQTVSEKYHKTHPDTNNAVTIPEELVVTPDETEHYLRFGWRYLATLPNGKVIVKRYPMES